MTKALFIGRFQPFHIGHLKLLKNVSNNYKEVIIGIGSSESEYTLDNPFSADERRMMIQKSLEDEQIENYKIVYIPDINNYPKWVDYVVSIVPTFDVVLSNNPLTQQLFSEKGYRIEKTPVFDRNIYSGKEIRKRMIKNEAWETLVPKSVVNIIKKVGGIERLKKAHKT